MGADGEEEGGDSEVFGVSGSRVVAYISLRNFKHSQTASITVVIIMLGPCANGLRLSR